MQKYWLVLVVLLLNFNNYCLGQNENIDNSCTAVACHGNLVAEEVVHTAVLDGCEKCHKETGKKHPLKGVAGYKLLEEIPNLCYKCHDENNTESNVHSPVAKGECLTCHTPHSSPKYYLLKENPVANLCGKCHEMAMTEKRVKHDPVIKGKCNKCHDPHEADNPMFLKKKTNDLCVRCHKDLKAILKSEDVLHMPFADDCTNCHDPHSSDNDHLTIEAIPNLCYKCHDENNTESNVHSPVAKGECLTCHTPHSSPKYYLLKENPVVNLCGKCHDLAMTQKSVQHDPVTKGKCNKCHDPHEADNPMFLKKKTNDLCVRCHKDIKAILKSEDVLHMPFADDCTNCHDPHSSDNEHLTIETIPNLCYKCHDENNTKSNVHSPVAKGECMTCHTPHSSPKYYLLKENPSSKLCGKCHDLAMTEKRVQHAPVSEGKCYKCHDPHESDDPQFLKKKTNDLCVRCHKDLKKVLKSEDVLHVPFAENCINCHDPHSSENDHLTNESVPNLCYKCHDVNNTKTHVHSPVAKGECMKCHTPHNSPKYYLLKENPSANLCAKCHIMSIADKKVQHKPVTEGKCHRCHDPHDSDNSKFLKKEIPNLCLRCHKDIKKQLKLKNVHTPFAENCVSCHDQIHGSTQDHLFLRPEKEQCLNCHNKKIPTESGEIMNLKELFEVNEFVHGAIEKEGCTACHSPHASEFNRLLNDILPEGEYAEGTKENFALCFKCHDEGLLEDEITDIATGFRNGYQNLHYFHVNREKGRTCINCHNPHAASNNKLIADKVGFGNWKMPINFTQLENGGSCRPGCHSEKIYKR